MSNQQNERGVITPEESLRLHEQEGKTWKEIGDMFGVSRDAARRQATKAGAITPPVVNVIPPDFALRQHELHGKTWAEIGDMFGVNRKAAERAAAKAKPLVPLPVEDNYRDNDNMKPVRREGDFMLTSDWHIPLFRAELAEEMLRDSYKYGLRRLVIAGDFWNFDALSDYLPKQNDAGLCYELKYGQDVLGSVLEHFDEIIITRGNHDHRVTKALGWKLRFEHTMAMTMPDIHSDLRHKLTFTGLDYCLIDTPRGLWRVCHTRAYSRQSLTVPSKLAMRHMCHVAGGHRHHYGVGKSPNGFDVVELGGLFDGDQTQYLHQDTTDFPQWTNGYVILQNGTPYLPQLCPAPRSKS